MDEHSNIIVCFKKPSTLSFLIQEETAHTRDNVHPRNPISLKKVESVVPILLRNEPSPTSDINMNAKLDYWEYFEGCHTIWRLAS